MTNLNQLLEETFDRLTVDMTPAEMLDTYEEDEFANDLEEVWGDDEYKNLPIEFDSWADVADALFEWAWVRTLS